MSADRKKHFFSFSLPVFSELEVKYVSEALRSGWITAGLRHRFLPIGNSAL